MEDSRSLTRVIICVDDDELVLGALRRELRMFLDASFHIEIADNGQEALEVLQDYLSRGYNIPIIITDYLMPNMRGDQLLEKAIEISPETYGIMLSGQADLEAVRNCIRYGQLQSFIFKPWEMVDLIGDIQKTINIYDKAQEIKQKNAELQEANIHLEEKVKKKTHELSIKNLELAEANVKLSELNEEKDSILGIVAHDLRSPLNNIHGLTQLIQSEVTGFDEQEHIALIYKMVEKSNQLIGDLLIVNRYEDRDNPLDLQEVDVYLCMQEVIDGFTQMATEKHIQIQLACPLKTCLLMSDEFTLSRILQNILSNAIKFSHSHKTIYIGIFIENEQIVIEIQDEGQGFTNEDIKKVFKKFQKMSAKSTAGEESTGLGLSIIKILTEKLRGTIKLESVWGEGSTFTLTFPL